MADTARTPPGARLRPPPVVDRETIVRPRLAQGAAPSSRASITLVSAPAGYGKTTALAYLASISDRVVAWYSAEPRDNHPLRFLDYIVAALAPIPNNAVPTESCDIDAEPIAERILAIARSLPHPTLLVIDDLHVLDNEIILEALRLVVEFSPPGLAFLFGSRSTSRLPVSRWRARGMTAEIGADDLRFSREETRDLCELWLDTRLDDDAIELLTRSTDGWAAAMRLMVARLRQEAPDTVHATLDRLADGNLQVVEYLEDEVLQAIPPEQRQVIERTSILGRLREDLCAAVVGDDYVPGTLLAVMRSGALISPLDERGEWFKYHPLFATRLQERLASSVSPGELAALHTRASDWWERHGDLETAIDHAIQARDWPRVAALIKRLPLDMESQLHVSQLAHWFDALPLGLLRDSPDLSLWYAWILLRSGQYDACQVHLQRAEHQSQQAGDTSILAAAAATRAFAAFYACDGASCVALARAALAGLDDSRPVEQRRAQLALALGEAHLGKATVAHALLDEFIQSEPPDSLLLPDATVHFCWTLWLQGRLADARARLLQFIAAEQAGRSDAIRRAYVILADIALETGKLDEATGYLEAADDRAARYGAAPLLADARARWATLWFRLGEYDRALGLLHAIRADAARSGNRRAAAKADTLGVRIWIVQGRHDLVEQWVRDRNLSAAMPVTFANEVEASTLAYWRMRQGIPADALPLANAICDLTERDGRVIHTFYFLVLRTLAETAAGQQPAASRTARRVMDLAHATGALMGLARGGDVLRQLMGDASSSPEDLNLLARLDAAVQSGASWSYAIPAGQRGRSGGGSLSLREIEVIRLIAIGLSNRDISSQLSIAMPTVKRHLTNVFVKLDASSRTEAVHKARLMDLL